MHARTLSQQLGLPLLRMLTAGVILTLAQPADARRGLPPITKWRAYRAMMSKLPPSGRSLTARGKALVRRIYRDTGFVLHDAGPKPNPDDHQNWTDREVQRMHAILSVLPAELKDLRKRLDPPADRKGSTSDTRWRGYFITRDSLNQQEQASHRLAEQRLRDQLKSGNLTAKQRVGAYAQLALVKAFRALNVGSVFGNAYRERPEIRLYNELFKGSRLPGLKGMLTFTTVHEIGHMVLFKDTALRAQWEDFYNNKGGRAEFAGWCGYAFGSLDEGFGVGVGTLAVAPKLLLKKAPKTHAFLRQLFASKDGADPFAKLHGRWTERLAIEGVYRLNDLIGKLASEQRSATAPTP